MPHPNGSKPPNPQHAPKAHGRKPPAPPPHSSRGGGCPLELVVAIPVTLFYALPRMWWDSRKRG